ncbi:hypothetical protein YG2_12760 [Tetragenococcus halophilus]|nr:hypothetical protein YG2_12760 [Tetragenococcus halophilus]
MLFSKFNCVVHPQLKAHASFPPLFNTCIIAGKNETNIKKMTFFCIFLQSILNSFIVIF